MRSPSSSRAVRMRPARVMTPCAMRQPPGDRGAVRRQAGRVPLPDTYRKRRKCVAETGCRKERGGKGVPNAPALPRAREFALIAAFHFVRISSTSDCTVLRSQRGRQSSESQCSRESPFAHHTSTSPERPKSATCGGTRCLPACSRCSGAGNWQVRDDRGTGPLAHSGQGHPPDCNLCGVVHARLGLGPATANSRLLYAARVSLRGPSPCHDSALAGPAGLEGGRDARRLSCRSSRAR